MYLTFAEYQAYGGIIESASFVRLEFMARKLVDSETFGRLKSETVISESVKRLMFELIGLIQKCDVSSEEYSAEPVSESNDGYSVSFNIGTIVTTDTLKSKSRELIERYLCDDTTSEGAPLLYCGM